MKNIILNKIAEIKNKFSKEDAVEETNSLSMKGAVAVVAGLHIAVVVGIIMMSSASKARAVAAEDKKFLENAPIVGVSETKPAEPTPTPVVVAEPTPTPKPKPTPFPKEMIKTKVPTNSNPDYPQFTKEYVVKKGDTFDKIVARYKVNGKKLQLLNNIKDPNKLSVGQKLKLM
jgi:LysM repeat protein